MNNCTFTGYMTDDPYISYVDQVALAEFTLVVYTYRRIKSTGEKNRIATYLNCEAWHTGAETLEKFAGKGTKLTINASARNFSKDSNNIVFRVNEFDICNQDFED
jgi:single-stranded DNA-binding protein